jgi:phenolic acid decarboxylase
MALLSFVESAPRAYRLKASNAAPPFSTSAGTSAEPSDEAFKGWRFSPRWIEEHGQSSVCSIGFSGADCLSGWHAASN